MDMYRGQMKTLYGKLQILEREGEELSRRERLEAMAGPLLSWYEGHARSLPWREDPRPYRVWVSEIMLQQTRVETVKPYFERFMECLPEVKDLAAVSEERLFKLWEGLGYYHRARNLKAAACVIMDKYEGRVPASYEELLSLPGIGSYTAGAVASIAFGIPVPAVDGNVLRVVSRVMGSREDILKQSVRRGIEEELRGIIPPGEAGSFNQGLIEVGALVCIPNGGPKCGECPFFSICLARKRGETGEIPVKTPKKARRREKRTVLILEYANRIAIRKREDRGLLASLYELPNLEGHMTASEVGDRFGVPLDRVEALPAAKHIFSHVEWDMVGYWVRLCSVERPDPDSGPGSPQQAYLLVSKEELISRYPLPNAFFAYMKLIN